MLSVVSLAFHPRDIGTLLIGYTEGAVIYSFKQNQPTKFFLYELARGAPGGDPDQSSVNSVRRPKLSHALWHPTGTFILTGHEDGSLVFWDPKEARIVMARTLQDTNVDKPGASSGSYGSNPGTFSVKEPLFKITWCSKANPDDTGILISGGSPTTLPTKGLTFLDLGPTPVYATSSWQVLSQHFEEPKRQRVLPTPPNAEVVDFCLIPRSSPYYAGAHDPIALLTLLSSGELMTLSFPSGHPISPTNQLHVSLSFVHPFVHKIAHTPVDRSRWLGMNENRTHGPPILNGGAEAVRPLKRFESRNVIQTAHADGTVRVWDMGHDDEVENTDVLQVDVARATGTLEMVEVSSLSMSPVAGELAVGLKTGEVTIFRWNRNRNFGREVPPSANEGPGKVTNILDRADPAVKEGLLPFTLLNQQEGRVTAIKMSDVGFMAVGYERGGIAILDMRGPAIIYQTHVHDLRKQGKRGSIGSIRRGSSNAESRPEWPTSIEFSVMSLEGEGKHVPATPSSFIADELDYSSILCFVGTNLAHLATFKILPEGQGYTVAFSGSCPLDDSIITTIPINANTGARASASQQAVAGLRDGLRVNGVLVAVTGSGVRVFHPPAAKGAHKSWDNFLCHAANVVRFEDQGYALVGLFGDGYARAFSLPALKEIGSARISHILDMSRLAEALITPTGDIVGWTSPSEIVTTFVWGNGTEM